MGGETVTGVGIKQADPFPDQPVLGRPRLPLVVALGRPWRVVGPKVVALLHGHEGDRHDGDARRIQPPDGGGTLRAEIGEHQGDVGPERLQIRDDRGIGEEGREACGVQLAGESQAGLRHGCASSNAITSYCLRIITAT